MTELNFIGVKNPEEARKQVMYLYTNLQRRIESRFMSAGRVPFPLFVASSKNRASSFLETYIKNNLHRKDMYVVDEPVWVVKGHKLRLSGKTFKIAVGGRLLPHKILTENDDWKELRDTFGYRIIDVPVEYKRSFENNMETALNDIAGIATEAGEKFMVLSNVDAVMGTIQNAFTIDLIKIGLKSPFSLQDFFLLDRVKDKIGKKIHIHLDLSKSGDMTGIGIVAPSTYKTINAVDSSTGKEFVRKDICYDVIGAVHLKALEGSEIPYYKIKEFVDWLSTEFTIGYVSADGFQSLEMIQYFTLKGWKSRVISVDRKPDPYYNLRSAIDEGRIRLPDIPLLRKEFLELEQGDNLKVDHPYDESGNPSGTKDLSDGICGACWTIATSKEVADIVDQEKERKAEQLSTLLDSALDTEDDFGWI